MNYSFDIVPIGDKYACKYQKRRDCIEQVLEYIHSDYVEDKICAIYGLRRTGKTVMIEQCIESLSIPERKKARSIICRIDTKFTDILEYINQEIEGGCKYFFIDEVTYAEGFQQIGEILANKFVGINDARIIVTGTDSLGLSLPTHDLQYNRTFFVHTTYISFAEYYQLMNCNSIDDYIQFGGVLQPDIFSDYYSTHEYITTSITQNLIRSLEKSEGLSRYPAALTEIYEKEELQNVVERIINKYSQDISAKAIRKEFEAGLISASIHNIARDRENPENYQSILKYDKLNQEIATLLGVKKNEDMCINVTDTHKQAVYEFLKEMEVFRSLPVYLSYDNEQGRQLEMITHPGICHANIYFTLSNLMERDNWVENVTSEQKNRLIQAAYNTACGNLMENIIIADMHHMLCHDKKVMKEDLACNSSGRWYVSKINCQINNKNYEVDVIVFDKKKKEAYLYEVKHSVENVEQQSQHIENPEFLRYIEDNFGVVKGRAVLYNGKVDGSSMVPRLPAGDFLLQVYKDIRLEDFSLDRTMMKICDNVGKLSCKYGKETEIDISKNDLEIGS